MLWTYSWLVRVSNGFKAMRVVKQCTAFNFLWESSCGFSASGYFLCVWYYGGYFPKYCFDLLPCDLYGM